MAVDTSRYEGARRGVQDEYAAKRVANEFGRFTSQQRGQRALGDYTKGFKRQQGQFMGGYAQRGLTGGGIRSGAFQRALQNRVTDYSTGLGRMKQDMDWQQKQYDMADAQLEAWRKAALADIDMQKAQEIALAALNINAIKPIIGGR